MRDPKRIQRILDKLGMIWNQVPDWRFTQLVENVLGVVPQDRVFFFVQDEEIEKILDEWIQENYDRWKYGDK